MVVTGRSNLLLLGSLVLIILGIALASLVNRFTSPGSESDIRAHAAAANRLKIYATVAIVNTEENTIGVSDIYFTEDSRSGEAKNLGSWNVTIPSDFRLTTVNPGSKIVIEVDPLAFNIAGHIIKATSIKLVK
jgi:hypothetical protein